MTEKPNIPEDKHGESGPLKPETRLVAGGRNPLSHHGFVNTPIYRGSTVLYPSADDFIHRRARYTYGTRGTPTTEALETAWSELSGAAGTVLVPSGLAAIAIALLSCLEAGDHLLVSDSVYRPTRNFCDTVLKRFGVTVTYYDPLIGSGVAALMQPNTRAVFTEAPGSQSFDMQDIPAIAEAAHAQGAVVLMDNTWATPLFFPPHARGADIAIEAGNEISRRPFRPPARPGVGERALLAAPARDVRRVRDLRRAGGRVPRPARPAHARGAAQAPSGGSTSRRALARRPAGNPARAPPGPRDRSRSRHLAARFFRRLRACSASCSSRCRRKPRTPSWMRSRCSESARPGAASRASSSRSTAPPTAPPPRGRRAGRHCASISGSKTSSDLTADLERGFAALAATA